MKIVNDEIAEGRENEIRDTHCTPRPLPPRIAGLVNRMRARGRRRGIHRVGDSGDGSCRGVGDERDAGILKEE